MSQRMELLSTNGPIQKLRLNFNLKQMRKRDQLTQIMLATTINRKRIRVYTKQRVEPRYWNKATCRCRTEQAPNLRERMRLDNINKQIDALEAALRQTDKHLAKKGKYLSTVVIRKTVETQRTSTDNVATRPIECLYKLVKEYPDTVNRRGKRGIDSTRQTYLTALKRLENYSLQREKPLDSFHDFDKNFFTDFADYLYTCTYQRGGKTLNYTQNTIVNTLKVIKNLLHRAYDCELTDNNSYQKVQTTLSADVSEQVYLNESEIEKMFRLKLTGQEAAVRDMFIIACYTALRFSDINRLNEATISDLVITLYQTKTKEEVQIPILKEISPLITRYQQTSFPKLNISRTNNIIRELARRCGINDTISYKEQRGGVVTIKQQPKWTKISFHTARRSCITNLYRRGYPINYIMTLSGHHSVQAFQRYVRASTQEIVTNFVDLLKKENAM